MMNWIKGTKGTDEQAKELEQISNDFEKMAPRIMLSVKSTWQLVLTSRAMQEMTQPEEKPTLMYLPLTEDLVLVPVIDTPSQKVLIHSQFLKDWKKRDEEIFEIAQSNLMKQSQQMQWETMHNEHTGRPVLYASADQDSYDAARIIFVDTIRSLEVEGEHLVAVPDDSRLLVTGSNDPVGVAVLVQEYTKARENPKAFPPIPLVYRNGQWQPFKLKKGDPIHEQLKLLQCEHYGTIYGGENAERQYY
jgi:uncharacterized protein YtpQ (UPF0354 family)